MAKSKPGDDGEERSVDLNVSGSNGARPLRKPLVTAIEAQLEKGAKPKGHPVRLWLTRGETLKLIEDLAAHLQEIDGSTPG